MANFNRDRNSRPGGFRPRPSFGGSPRFAGGAGKPRFADRSDRGPVEMYKAVCDNCGKDCEVPFRPTSGKPVYCSNCFERNSRDSGSGRFESRGNDRTKSFEERVMFDAVCDECGNSCKVPFSPTGDKPVYCSNCFGEKKGAGNRDSGQSYSQSQPQSQQNKQLDELNSKLDKILQLLGSNSNIEKSEEKTVIEPLLTKEDTIKVKKTPAKKKSSKKSK